MDPYITFRSITKVFPPSGGKPAFQALKPISFDVPKGEFFTIIGPSGCGKSTLLNVLAGLEVADTGEVCVDGRKVKRPGPDRAVVFQEAGLLPWMTVRQNVEYGLKLAGVKKVERRERAEHYLRMVHLWRFADNFPHELSGGMRQRGSIARGLALEPAVLLMDEPFSALDAQTRDILHEELQRIWQETHTTIVFVTHNLQEAVYLSDRILVMTASPGSVKSIIEVPFTRPRAKDAPEIAAFAARLHGQIRDEVISVAKRELDPDWVPDRIRADMEKSIELGDGI